MQKGGPSKEDLAQLSQKSIAAYASRHALRALPFIKHRSTVDFAMALMAPILYSKGVKLTNEELDKAAKITKSLLEKLKYHFPTFSAGHSSSSIISAVGTCLAENNQIAADLAEQASVFALSAVSDFSNISNLEYDSEYDSIIAMDYGAISELSNSNEDLFNIYKETLWFESNSGIDDLISEWCDYLIERNAGHVFDRYMHFFNGTVDRIDWEEVEAEVRHWIASSSDASGETADNSEGFPEAEQPPNNEYATSKGGGMSDVDLLGRGKLIHSLASMIASDNQDTPFTIGLLGDWGSGKSNLMHLLKNDLKARPDAKRFYFADFNAWEYEHTDNMTAGVAQEVLNGFFDKPDYGLKIINANIYQRSYYWLTYQIRRFYKFVWKIWIRLKFGIKEQGLYIPVVLLIALLVIIFTSSELIVDVILGQEELDEKFISVILLVASVAVLIKNYKWLLTIIDHPLTAKLNSYLRLPDYMSHLGTIPMLKNHLRILSDILIPQKYPWFKVSEWKNAPDFLKKWHQNRNKSSRLIVFVDDLDRCEPDAISRTLDAIRLVMDIKNVVVIIGIDHRIAFRAIEMQYSELSDDKRTSADIAREYLGKIIQLPIQLPKPDLNTFINEMLFKGYEKDEENEAQSSAKEKTEGKKAAGKEITDPDFSDQESSFANSLRNSGRSDSTETDDKNIGQDIEAELDNSVAISIEMVETSEEVKHFKELIELFEFDNPRQLIRLRNCYRLLKGLEQSTTKELRLIMVMLFWLEYVYSQRQEKRDKILDNGKPDYTRLGNENQMKELIQNEFSEEGSYEAYLNKVSYVVLPHSESPERAKREYKDLDEDEAVSP